MNETSETKNIDKLIDIMNTLRSPGGCPWDLEQSHETLKKYALEETYELLDAIESGDDDQMKEELGDVLLQVVFHARIAQERGAFTFDDVAEAISSKLVERHPHVFGDLELADSKEVLENWERIKARTKKKTPGEKSSRFSGLPKALPALLMAVRIAERAPEAERERKSLEKAVIDAGLNRENIGEFLQAIALLAHEWELNPEEEVRRKNLEWISRLDEQCSR